ncbi:MAG: hypothetical protein J5623_02615 [Clostridiales bacterium]|nr:hypothetical protein [Clostridiales bacterium]
MTEEIKAILKRYDEIGALILEQKLDEYGDKIGQVPEGSDAASFEEYLQQEAKEETEKAKKVLESEPDEKLGGKSLREYFDGLTLEEKEEALEYSALNLDCGAPESLIASIAADDRESVRDYCSTVIGNSAWTEDELNDEDKLFEIEYQKVKACLDVLIAMKEFCFVKAVLDRFMSYHQTKEFVAESIKDYVVGAADVSIPILMDIIEENLEDGLEGPSEDIVIMLAEIGMAQPSEEIYQTLRHAFRAMKNKIYAVICLAEYGDDRAVPLMKNYINRHQDSIDRDLFYEMMSAIQKLGGDISDINDPFGDFTRKSRKPEGKKYGPARYNGNK